MLTNNTEMNATTSGLSQIVFLALLIWSVDALFLQAQMLLLHSTPLPNLVVKAIFAAALVAGAFRQWLTGSSKATPAPLFRIWLLFAVFLLVETFYLMASYGLSLEYVLFRYNANYFRILFLPMFYCFEHSNEEDSISRALGYVFVPLAVLGVAQHFAGSVLLPTRSSNGYLEVMSWDFYGTVRGFSLFNAPSYFGHFIALMAALGMAFYKSKKRALQGLVLLILAVASGYSTLTRATQIEIAFAIFTVWLLYRWPGHRKLLLALPVFYAFLGFFTAFVIPLWLAGSNADLLANDSLLERYAEWANYSYAWVGNGLVTFLFGAGVTQNARFETSADVLIDNSFLSVGLHIGAVGLVLWIVITWRAWKYMLDQAPESVSPVQAAAIGAWSVWLFTSVFNNTLFYILPFVVFLMTNRLCSESITVAAPRARSSLRGESKSVPSLGEECPDC